MLSTSNVTAVATGGTSNGPLTVFEGLTCRATWSSICSSSGRIRKVLVISSFGDHWWREIKPISSMAMSYESPHWLTFRQAIQLGGNVKKGEKACPVVFWKKMEIEDKKSGEPQKKPLLRLYHVFNAAQCEGLKDAPEEIPMPATKPAEIVAKMPQPPVVKHGMAQAFYSPTDDCIGMPEPERFESEASYFAALFHELVHATGHEKRLKRARSEEHTSELQSLRHL